MKKYLTETHLHTKESSSCAKVNAQEIVDAYIKKGYKTIIITDHCSRKKMDRLGNITWKEKMDFVFNGYNIAYKYSKDKDINVLLGIEVTLEETNSDYLIYGIDKKFLYNNEEIFNYSLEKLYNICHNNDLLLIQAHPFRKNMQLAPINLIDGIEAYNGCKTNNSYNNKAIAYGKKINKILTSGSDFHRMFDLTQGGIITTKEIKSYEDLKRILKKRNYKLRISYDININYEMKI